MEKDRAKLRIADATIPVEPSPHERQLQALNEIALIANLDLELRPMLQRITDALARHFGWQLVALANRTPEGFICEALTSSGPTTVHIGYSRALGTGVVGEVASTMQPIILDDVRLHANFVDTTPGILSEICVPVKHKGEMVGVLNIESTRLAAFHDQLPLLQTVADQIAGAIASARVYEDLTRRARLLQMMSDISRTALEAENLQEFLDRVVTYVHDQLAAEIVSIRLYDSAREEYLRAADAGIDSHDAAMTRWPVTAGVIGRCFRTRKTQLVLDVENDPDYIPGNPSVVAELVIPILFRNELLGVFNIESSKEAMFTRENVVVFEAIADQMAGSLRLFRANDELLMARRGQQEANETLTRMVEKFEDMSAHDAMTGLFNRSHFDQLFPVEWRRAGRTRLPLSLLLVDIDSFKAYNDARGHRAGDEALKAVAKAIAQTVHRAGDVVVRYGGEEFAVLLPNTDSESARGIAENIRKRVSDLQIAHPTAHAQHITISIGVGTSVPDGDERHASAFIDVADLALYDAKRGGRNRVIRRVL